jgi:hypothetical protein
VPEIIDPVFAKTSQNARFLLSENERFGLVFVKTGSINSGTGVSSLILFPLFAAGVVDTGGNLPLASLTPAANLLPVLLTPAGKIH